jgi:hypothetical protein
VAECLLSKHEALSSKSRRSRYKAHESRDFCPFGLDAVNPKATTKSDIGKELSDYSRTNDYRHSFTRMACDHEKAEINNVRCTELPPWSTLLNT